MIVFCTKLLDMLRPFRLDTLYTCSLALAINHRELSLYLGEVRSVAQCKLFFWGGGGGGGGWGEGRSLALFSDLTVWLFDEAQTNLGNGHSPLYLC